MVRPPKLLHPSPTTDTCRPDFPKTPLLHRPFTFKTASPGSASHKPPQKQADGTLIPIAARPFCTSPIGRALRHALIRPQERS